MHFHLPKPLHGWREFAGEVGIIVVGVMIALGAEQVVQNVHDRHVAEATRAQLQEELETDLTSLVLRRAAEPCITRRLGEVRLLLSQWARTGTFKRPQWIAAAPFSLGYFERYDAAVAAGRVGLLPNEEQAHLGRMAGNLRAFDEIQIAEAEPWSVLRLLQMGSDDLTASDRTMAWQALQHASMLDYRARLRVRQALPLAADYGYRPNLSQFRQIASRVYKNGRFTPAICVDISTPAGIANSQSGMVTAYPQ